MRRGLKGVKDVYTYMIRDSKIPAGINGTPVCDSMIFLQNR